MNDLKKNLYKLPFSKHNNPNGWIEPTTFCQLKCPHCYRGVCENEFKPIHRNLQDLLSEVDQLVKIRNIQTLSIAGGEPLLYPDLDKLIKYAANKKLKIYLITNGILINRERLLSLKESGVNRIMIHIDKYQNRKEKRTETEVNELREEYCNLFRKIKGISLGFMMPISSDNFQDLEILLLFFKNNADVIKEVGLTVLCEVLPEKQLPKEKMINPEKIFFEIKRIYGLEYSAFLGKTCSEEISWLYSYNIFSGKKLLGSMDKNAVKFIQEEYYRRKGKYLFLEVKNFSLKMLSLLFNRSVIKILWKNVFKIYSTGLQSQSLFVISTPQKKGTIWNYCDGCPDAILYNNDLVPSCLLERVKKGEDIAIK